MRFGPRTIFGAIAAIAPIASARPQYFSRFEDPAGDAVLRRTDLNNDAAIHPASVFPDLLSVQVGAWLSPTPTTDPYKGAYIDPHDACLFRLDVVFKGVVNPPGTLGLAGQPYAPYMYGASPVLGFIEIDMDDDHDTGGEIGAGAGLRYLANVARFSTMPTGQMFGRAAKLGSTIDSNFFTSPQIERSGADFSLTLCGCFPVTVVDNNGDTDGIFNTGDTWIVSGRFFQRAGGYQGASAAYGGSVPGLYDPIVNLRFQHDVATDTTTITLVWALNQHGAALMAGQSDQPLDLNVANQASIHEAMEDIVEGAQDGLFGATRILAGEWAEQCAHAALNPTRWHITALVGTSYFVSQDSLYAWTDVGFDGGTLDLNSDGHVDKTDRDLVSQFIYANDNGPIDADGSRDGRVTLGNFANNFSLYDANYDGVVDENDVALVPTGLLGDINGDCSVNTLDLTRLLQHFGLLSGATFSDGDLNGDGVVNTLDLIALLGAFGSSCP